MNLEEKLANFRQKVNLRLNGRQALSILFIVVITVTTLYISLDTKGREVQNNFVRISADGNTSVHSSELQLEYTRSKSVFDLLNPGISRQNSILEPRFVGDIERPNGTAEIEFKIDMYQLDQNLKIKNVRSLWSEETERCEYSYNNSLLLISSPEDNYRECSPVVTFYDLEGVEPSASLSFRTNPVPEEKMIQNTFDPYYYQCSFNCVSGDEDSDEIILGSEGDKPSVTVIRNDPDATSVGENLFVRRSSSYAHEFQVHLLIISALLGSTIGFILERILLNQQKV